MIEPNIIWLETLVGDFINISTIHRIYFTRGSKGKLYCVMMETNDGAGHELLQLPDEGDIIGNIEIPFKFQSEHARMLARECASTISDWGRDIISSDHLSKRVWKQVCQEVSNNLPSQQEVQG